MVHEIHINKGLWIKRNVIDLTNTFRMISL